MTNYNIIPIYSLNKYIEGRLRNESIIPLQTAYVNDMDSQDEFGIPFMSPAAQLPEVTTVFSDESVTPTVSGFTDLPICTYTWKQDSTRDQPWMQCGTATYTFYSGDIDKLFEIAQFIQVLTKREDRTAYDINYYFKADDAYPWDFKSVNFMTGAGPNPTKDEGGRYSYMCVINYDCTYEGPDRVDEYVSNGQINIGMW